MSQICYRIMESLFKRQNHVRGLAQELKTNQTTVARKLKELRQENILDYRDRLM